MAIECGNIWWMICSYLRSWKLFCSKLHILGRQNATPPSKDRSKNWGCADLWPFQWRIWDSLGWRICKDAHPRIWKSVANGGWIYMEYVGLLLVQECCIIYIYIYIVHSSMCVWLYVYPIFLILMGKIEWRLWQTTENHWVLGVVPLSCLDFEQATLDIPSHAKHPTFNLQQEWPAWKSIVKMWHGSFQGGILLSLFMNLNHSYPLVI